MLHDRHRSRLLRNTVNSIHTSNHISCSRRLSILLSLRNTGHPLIGSLYLFWILAKYISRWVVLWTYLRLACWCNGSLRRQDTNRPSYQPGHRLKTARSLKEQVNFIRLGSTFNNIRPSLCFVIDIAEVFRSWEWCLLMQWLLASSGHQRTKLSAGS